MRWIVLLRGVNVGGHGKTPMAELRKHLTGAGAENVATYIQSGNLIFDYPETDPAAMAEWVSDLIASRFGHRPPALAFSGPELAALHAANPFDAVDEPRFMHFHLFRDAPHADAIGKLTPDLYDGEKLHLTDTCLYHWSPKGFGISKAAQKVPGALGVTTTARNLKSMRAILDLV